MVVQRIGFRIRCKTDARDKVHAACHKAALFHSLMMQLSSDVLAPCFSCQLQIPGFPKGSMVRERITGMSEPTINIQALAESTKVHKLKKRNKFV
jgi:hypothetical protein